MDSPIIPILLIGAVMYFLIIRPQIQERRSHEQLLQALAKDDEVVTSSGIWGRVVEVGDKTVVLDVGDKTRVTFDKAAVARRASEQPPEKG